MNDRTNRGIQALELVKDRMTACGFRLQELGLDAADRVKKLKGRNPITPTRGNVAIVADAIYDFAHDECDRETRPDIRRKHLTDRQMVWKAVISDFNLLGGRTLPVDCGKPEFRSWLQYAFGLLSQTTTSAGFEPFTFRGAIEDSRAFHGRAELLYQVESRKNAVQLNGNRKVGKSSLLREAGRRLMRGSSNSRFAYVDMMASSVQTQEGFFGHIAREWQMPSAPKNNLEFSKQWDEVLKPSNLAFVLAIDEADKFAEESLFPKFHFSFFENLRSICQDGLRIWFGCKRPLGEIAKVGPNISPFNITPACQVSLFTEQESMTFLDSAPGVHFDSAERQAILAWAGRHPCKLQIACYNVKLKREFNGTLQEAMASAENEWNDLKPMD